MSRVYHPDFRTVVVSTAPHEDPLVLEGIVRKLADGSLFLSWTGGGDAEPREENVTKYSRSFDNGCTWTSEEILFSHPKKGIFTPALFVDGTNLYAFPNSYYNDTNFSQDMQSYISVSHDCGATFSAPRSLPGCINNVHIKCTLKVGKRWIFPCSWIEITGHYWASYINGNKPCIVGGKVTEPEETDQCAVCNSNWYGNHTEYCGVLISEDEGKSFQIRGRIGHEGTYFVEPMMTVLSDGTFVMLLRTGEKRLYESRSYDSGETWTEPKATDIPSAITKVLLLKDSLGRIYLVHNPNGDSFHRSPLALWISEDDMQTWKYKIELARDDTMPLCYPDGFLDEERQMLCLSWDDRKNIYYSEFPIG